MKEQIKSRRRKDRYENKIVCLNCKGNTCFIDEWNGWKWTCYNCDKIFREATKDEIKELENENNRLD